MNPNEIPQEDIENGKQLAAMSYMWLFSVVILFTKRNNSFIQLHARQGTVLFIISILFWLISYLRILEFAVLALMILGFIEASQGKPFEIPFIGDIARGKFGVYHLKKGWHSTKHTAIKLFDPNHITPAFREELQEQYTELKDQEKKLTAEERLLEKEEKKLSSLFHRIENDEKEISQLKDKVEAIERAYK
jgi:uncharacterized membrane protein